METHDATVWLQPVDDACGGCAPSTLVTCEASRAERVCLSPGLHGDADRLAQLLDSLRTVRDAAGDRNLVDGGLIDSLRLAEGEAELALTFAPSCGIHKQMAEQAFQVMRQCLPDTDVFVFHAP